MRQLYNCRLSKFLSISSYYPLMMLLGIITLSVSILQAQPPGGGPPPDKIFDYMDRNKDGRLTADETERMPGHFKELLQEKRFDLEKGIPRDKFIEAAPKLFEESRARREEEERKHAEERNNESKNSANSNNNSSNKKEVPKSSAIWVPPKKERVTMELSKNYLTLDTDSDDQIGLYEWRSANKGTATDFDTIDLNHDGFLTPKEIAFHEAKPKTSITTAVKPSTSPVTKPDSSATSPNAPATMPKEITKLEKKAEKQEAKENKSNDEEKLNSEALYLIGILDKNKDGMINPDEWAISKKLKPAFEQAGINMSQDMSKDDFIANYLKVGNGWRK